MSDALASRIRLMLGRAILKLVNDATGIQSMQVELLSDEVQDDVERFQDYGFTSRPHPEAEAIVACMGGLRSHSVIIAVDDRRFRLKNLQEGEVALYDDLGNLVKLGRDALEIVGASKVKVSAPEVDVISENVNLGGTGGQKVARVGDTVDLSTGIITSGSSKVKAA